MASVKGAGKKEESSAFASVNPRAKVYLAWSKTKDYDRDKFLTENDLQTTHPEIQKSWLLSQEVPMRI